MKLGLSLDGWWSWLRREGGAAPRSVPQADKPVPGAVPSRATAARSETLARQLALVIDLDVCVGCQACVVVVQAVEPHGPRRAAARQETRAAAGIARRRA